MKKQVFAARSPKFDQKASQCNHIMPSPYHQRVVVSGGFLDVVVSNSYEVGSLFELSILDSCWRCVSKVARLFATSSLLTPDQRGTLRIRGLVIFDGLPVSRAIV
jgi:hypothetical protein